MGRRRSPDLAEPRKTIVSVSIDPELLGELDRIADRTRISRSVLICDGIKVVVANHQLQQSLQFETGEAEQSKSPPQSEGRERN